MATLEELLTGLTTALTTHSADLKANTAALKAVAGAAAGGAKAGGAAAGGGKPATTPPAGAATITEAEVADRVSKYLKTGTPEDRELAKTHVRAIVEHYGAAKFTAIAPKQFKAALADLEAFAQGGAPSWHAEEDAGGDDDSMI